MGKTYINTTKYTIHCNFEIAGIVDKHDIIGAIFGQSEGLLGEDMDLRELQSNGKIGRIEVIPESVLGKTKGKLTIPSSLDMVQTSMLAASIESIEKVGPYDSRFEILAIEDTRSAKRGEIKDRAKELLKKFMKEELPDTHELEEEIREKVRTEDIVLFGKEGLPAGPEIETKEAVIIVEGRADVLALLRNGLKNVIGMDGSKLPESIIELSKRKETTLFVDGDRGGELIARQVLQAANIDFVARAPDGKEVEELTKKEINMALKKKVKSENMQKLFQTRTYARSAEREYSPARTVEHRTREYAPRTRSYSPRGEGRSYPERRSTGYPARGTRSYSPRGEGRSYGRRTTGYGARKPFGFGGRRPYGRREFDFEERFEPREIEIPATAEERAVFEPIMKELRGTLKARIFDAEMKQIGEMNVRELIDSIKSAQGVQSIVFDGIITKRLAEESKVLGVKIIVGVRKSDIGKIEGIKTIVLKE